MKEVLVILLIILSNMGKSQVSDTVPPIEGLSVEKSQWVNLYDVDSNIKSILRVIVDNCNADISLKEDTYSFLFFVRDSVSSLTVIATPIIPNSFVSPRFHGVFYVDGRKFYCAGSVADFFNLVSDSFELKPFAQDSVYSLSWDLHTSFVTKSVVINNKRCDFFIQPCTDLSKKTLRKKKLRKAL